MINSQVERHSINIRLTYTAFIILRAFIAWFSFREEKSEKRKPVADRENGMDSDPEIVMFGDAIASHSGKMRSPYGQIERLRESDQEWLQDLQSVSDGTIVRISRHLTDLVKRKM